MTQQLDARLNPHAPAVLSLFRIVFGLLFLNHAVSHLFGWPAAAGPAAPVGLWPYWWAGLLELITSVLITIGLFTRIAAFLASGIMAFAYFTQHLPNAFPPLVQGGGETAVMNCFAFFLLVFTGGGLYALDSRRRSRVVTTGTRRRGWRR
jgi:putative oxidoreductase